LISLNLKFSFLEGATMQPLLYQANLYRGLILAHEFHDFLMAAHSLAVKSSRTIDDIVLIQSSPMKLQRVCIPQTLAQAVTREPSAVHTETYTFDVNGLAT
jgi:hypothetical protein